MEQEIHKGENMKACHMAHTCGQASGIVSVTRETGMLCLYFYARTSFVVPPLRDLNE